MDFSDCPRVIWAEDFDERSAFETPLRGYLSDVVVEGEDGARFVLFFVDTVRLGQELAQLVKMGEPCFAEPNTIVVPEVTVEAIEEAVRFLWKSGYFRHLKPTEPEGVAPNPNSGEPEGEPEKRARG